MGNQLPENVRKQLLRFADSVCEASLQFTKFCWMLAGEDVDLDEGEIEPIPSAIQHVPPPKAEAKPNKVVLRKTYKNGKRVAESVPPIVPPVSPTAPEPKQPAPAAPPAAPNRVAPSREVYISAIKNLVFDHPEAAHRKIEVGNWLKEVTGGTGKRITELDPQELEILAEKVLTAYAEDTPVSS